MDKTQTLWQETALAAPPEQFPPLNESLRCDVAIVGAGYTGLSAARTLAKRGVHCVVLEASEVGHGGSGRNVGLVNAGLWLPPAQVVGALGEDVGGRLNRALGEGPSRVFSLIEQYSIDCEPLRNGTLHLAHSRAGLRELESRREQLAVLGAPVQLHPREHTQSLTGTHFYRAALQDARAGTVQPLGYARGLALAATAHGAVVHSHSRVSKIAKSGQCWRLATAHGEVTAESVIIASNAYSDTVWPGLSQAIIPIHFFQCASDPLGASASAHILPERHGCWDTQKLMMSLRKDGDGRLIFGSIGAASRGRDDTLLRHWAQRIAKKLYPEFGEHHFPHCWHGRIAFTPEPIPRLYRLAPGVLSCAGYNGRGIAPGTVCGEALAGLLLGTLTEREFPLPVRELKGIAFNRLRAQLIEQVARWVHFAQGRLS